ncbi:proline racemase family protein [Paenarthrobacter histidinolovorans]|uniref:proline racemase family protein n=1 Tax=Paenarthrobacter histidinolovorans TaxID=43664 RepID=UPI00166B9D26|nr:proline racemase family protein [Paenarthrobacter histidinolovorans]GGJ40400.1 proline racemase [Paenarthrobacter histidinolovorans]
MKTQRIVNCWDYHHGQSTRILVSGFPAVPGETMQDKQDYFEANLDGLRAALCREPRGHRNMLGAIITAPVNDDSLIGVLFTSPDGYFDMCGDSSFSLGAYLVDSGVVQFEDGEQTRKVLVDTVAGQIFLELTSRDSELESVAIGNVPSRYLGTAEIKVDGFGPVTADLGYGGLVYAFVPAKTFGINSLQFTEISGDEQRRVIEAGTAFLAAAKRTDTVNPIELVVLTEETDDPAVSRVSNFYAPGTMGRTPSGTGLSARLAVEHGKGRLEVGQSFSQESALGLQFHGVIDDVVTGEEGELAVIPRLTAKSYLMGISQIVFKEDDVFKDGFSIHG